MPSRLQPLTSLFLLLLCFGCGSGPSSPDAVSGSADTKSGELADAGGGAAPDAEPEPDISDPLPPPADSGADPAGDAQAGAAGPGSEPAGERSVPVGEFDFTPGGPISDEELGNYHVVMGASIDGEDVGEMAFAFWPEKAPVTVRNFLRLSASGFYDGLTYHRVVREFMVQGGCPDGTGAGESPLGRIVGEFSEEPQWRHRYGVLSMARLTPPDSGGCQFFLINHDGMSAWSLDGKYASFGRMTKGVATLEALSDSPVSPNPMNGEVSMPNSKLVIRFAKVVKGPAPTGEVIERPMVQPDLKGQPARVHVESALVSFAGTNTRATRSKEEAETLAKELLQRVEDGEDLVALSKEFSDEPLQVKVGGDEHLGFRILNDGVQDPAQERLIFERYTAIQKKLQARQQAQQRGELTLDAFREEIQQAQIDHNAGLRREVAMPRGQLGRQGAIAEVAFTLKVGEAALVPFDAAKSPDGWYLIRRVE